MVFSPEEEAVAVADAGPSQCLKLSATTYIRKQWSNSYQWSPWGSQPTDSVGLGTVGVALVAVASLEEEVVAGADAGPSQCLYRTKIR